MAKTGEHCPLSGWWASDGPEGNGHYIGEGSIMPAVSGVSVTWSLVDQFSSRKPKHEHPPVGGFISSY